MALSFNRRGGVCPPEDINLSICGRIRAGKPCPYKYLAKADIHFTILNERAVIARRSCYPCYAGFAIRITRMVSRNKLYQWTLHSLKNKSFASLRLSKITIPISLSILPEAHPCALICRWFWHGRSFPTCSGSLRSHCYRQPTSFW